MADSKSKREIVNQAYSDTDGNIMPLKIFKSLFQKATTELLCAPKNNSVI